MKKNCYNCVNLTYEFGDIGDPEGYVCLASVNKFGREEDSHLAKLEKESYREKAKVCCELKTNLQIGNDTEGI